jgi:tetratricopeptide (TPR) repeat protein
MLVSLLEATEDAELFDRARHHAELSLTVNSREGSPERWAMAHQVLGRLHMRRAELSEGASRDEAASVALQHFERALEARTITVDPARRLDTLKYAAAIHFRNRAWDEALALYVDAMRTSDQLLGAAFTEDARLAGVSPGTGLYRSAAYCLEKLNDPTAALICLDWGKGRMLAEALAVQDLDRFHLAAAERDEIAVLRGEVRRLEYVMRSAGNALPQEYSEWSEALSSARAALNQTVAAATMASDLFNQTRLTHSFLDLCQR